MLVEVGAEYQSKFKGSALSVRSLTITLIFLFPSALASTSILIGVVIIYRVWKRCEKRNRNHDCGSGYGFNQAEKACCLSSERQLESVFGKYTANATVLLAKLIILQGPVGFDMLDWCTHRFSEQC